MTIRIRLDQVADTSFILSLITRFSEFELPAWRKSGDVCSRRGGQKGVRWHER